MSARAVVRSRDDIFRMPSVGHVKHEISALTIVAGIVVHVRCVSGRTVAPDRGCSFLLFPFTANIRRVGGKTDPVP